RRNQPHSTQPAAGLGGPGEDDRRLPMDGAAAGHARERLMRWLDEGREIVGALAEQLDAGMKSAAKVEHAERDAERLRRELMELRKQLSEAKDQVEHNAHDKQLEEYRRQVDELRRANDQLKAEK